MPIRPMGQKQVNVIGHYHEGMQLIPATRKQVGDYTLSNFWTSQPLWLIRGTIQQLIAPGENPPTIGARLQSRECTAQSPSYENGSSRRMPIRKIASIHLPEKWENTGDFLLVSSKTQAEACATILH